jgi:nucleoside-diphosphate-sugar epimerase
MPDARIGDVTDAASVRAAISGCDTVIHLAAERDDAPFLEVLLEPNVVGLFTVMNAAREAAVRRVVLASSVQVVGRWPRDGGPAIAVDETNPGNHYALTKHWAEDLGAMYARHFGLGVLACASAGWCATRTRRCRWSGWAATISTSAAPKRGASSPWPSRRRRSTSRSSTP